MDRELKLEEHYLDDHLRPLKIDGEKTSLEIAKSGARISGGLEITGPGKSMVADPLITNDIYVPDSLIIKSENSLAQAIGGNSYFRHIHADLNISDTTQGVFEGLRLDFTKSE